MIEMKQEIYIEISGDILREKHKQKTKVKTHFRDKKNNRMIWIKPKIYIETSRDILKEKK